MIRFVLVRNSLRHIRVIAFTLTASNDERCVVRSRLKHQLSQLSLSLRKNSKFCSRTGFISAFSSLCQTFEEAEINSVRVSKGAPQPLHGMRPSILLQGLTGLSLGSQRQPGVALVGYLACSTKPKPKWFARKNCRKYYKMVSRIEAMGGRGPS